MEKGVNNMGIEYSIVLEDKEKIDMVIEKIFSVLKSNEMYKDIIMDQKVIVFPYDDVNWNQWCTIENDQDEIYIWTIGNRRVQESKLIEEIYKVIESLSLQYELEEI
ncbi:hypothetical protein [Lysinibacillus sp. G4S2]|uniref:hypothetical protein n=1 Tax=Lysinibacillus sp. G4S2 TaxID=3055859 RepID=UPI0025A10A85|nr:hypothetical protein [Lysinibacillus sp. G4S2]MDM5247984.1 hypothetical protein [Lysinibacillus sp. G4S2]